MELARLQSIEAFLALRYSPHQCQQHIISLHIDTMARDVASVTVLSAAKIYAWEGGPVNCSSILQGAIFKY